MLVSGPVMRNGNVHGRDTLSLSSARSLDGAAISETLPCAYTKAVVTFVPLPSVTKGIRLVGGRGEWVYPYELPFSTKCNHKLTPFPIGQLGTFKACMSALEILSARFLHINDVLGVINKKKKKMEGRT